MDSYSGYKQGFKVDNFFSVDAEEFLTWWNMKAGARYQEEQGRPLLNPNQ